MRRYEVLSGSEVCKGAEFCDDVCGQRILIRFRHQLVARTLDSQQLFPGRDEGQCRFHLREGAEAIARAVHEKHRCLQQREMSRT